MTDDCYLMYAPLTGFLVLLAQGWRLNFIVEPMPGNHGKHSLWVWKPLDE